MTPHPWVVVGEMIKGFDTLDEARRYARRNPPAVICLPQPLADGTRRLVEYQRYDLLYDEARGEWRAMFSEPRDELLAMR